MAKIAVDVDSILYRFEEPFREACQKLGEQAETEDERLAYFKGVYMPWPEWRAPTDVLGVDRFLKALAEVHSDDMILGQQPLPGAAPTLMALIRAGHQLFYISNRRTEAKRATWRWLGQNGFPLFNADMVCTDDGKASYVRDCQYIIDDRPRTLVEFVHDYDWLYNTMAKAWEEMGSGPDWQSYVSDNSRRGFGIIYDYNRNLTDIRNVYLAPTWAGLNYYLVDKGLLPEAATVALEV